MASEERDFAHDDFRRRVAEASFVPLEARFPRPTRLVVHHELATPLSTVVSMTGHHRGAFYGLDITRERVLSNALRPRTPLEGLRFTGRDVGAPGNTGKVWGGPPAAASIDPKILCRRID